MLAVDLGTGGPKVGLVSLTGAIAWSEHLPVATRRGPGGAATQDAERVVAADRRRPPGGPCGADVVRAEQIVAVSCTGQWASTVPGRRRRPPGRASASCGRTPGAARLVRQGGGRARSAATPPSPWPGGSATAAARRRRRAPTRSATCCSSSTTSPTVAARRPLVPGAGRLPVHALHRRGRGLAGLDGRGLADRQPPTRTRSATTRSWSEASGVPAHKLPPLRPDRSAWSGRSCPAVADDLGLGPGVVVIAGTPDLHSAAAGAGAVLAYQPHLAISTTSWISCPFPRKKTDPSGRWPPCRASSPGSTWWPTTRSPAGGALTWLRRLPGATEDGPDAVRSVDRPWPPRPSRAAAGSSSPRGWPASAPRSTTAGPGPASTTCRCGPPGPHLVRAVLEGVAFNSRWLSEGVERFVGRALRPDPGHRRRRHLGPVVLDPRQCPRPDHRAGGRPGARQPPRRRPAGRHGPRRGGRRGDRLPGAGGGHLPSRPADRDVYDRLFAEFPALYSAQKGLFKRLNRRR